MEAKKIGTMFDGFNDNIGRSDFRFMVSSVSDKIDNPTNGHINLNNSINLNSKKVTALSFQNYIPRKESLHETLPKVEHYKNNLSFSKRPSLYDLHKPKAIFQQPICDVPSTEDLQHGISKGAKFGWIKGVTIRCVLNIWGVMLFLRLTWIVGQAGIGLATVIVLLSVTVTIITSMSMSAICTNGEVKGGGAYFMISRNLGPEFGGAIGVIYSLASVIAVSINVVGLAEAVVEIIQTGTGTLYGISPINWTRIVGCISVVFLLGVALAGMEWEYKAQFVFLIILLVSFANYFVGSLISPSKYKEAKGFAGYKAYLFRENFKPDFRMGESFFSIFAIYFPSATGILAGANISGDLKDAQNAIPKGTFLAILITTLSYLAIIWTSGGCGLRAASGSIVQLMQPQNNSSLQSAVPFYHRESELRSCDLTQNCKFGLLYDYHFIELASGAGWIIVAGIFSATLSSAMACFIGCSKVFQAVCRDKLFPFIHFFAIGSKKNNDPLRVYFLAFIITILFVLLGDLNVIATIMSNFFLMAYALINYSCFHATISKSVGFRPGFKYYNRWISLIGGILCVATMLLIKWWAALVTLVAVFFLYLYIRIKKPDVNWGSSTQSHVYMGALDAIFRLNETEEHVKTFRPQILALTGDPRIRPSFVDFANLFTKKISLLICGHVIKPYIDDQIFPIDTRAVYKSLKNRHLKALYNCTISPSFKTGVRSLMEVSGLGRLTPNIIMMGFKSDWRSVDIKDVEQYFSVIHDAFDMRLAVGILKVSEGLDCSYLLFGEKAKKVKKVVPLRRNTYHDACQYKESYCNASFVQDDEVMPNKINRGKDLALTTIVEANSIPDTTVKNVPQNGRNTLRSNSDTSPKPATIVKKNGFGPIQLSGKALSDIYRDQYVQRHQSDEMTETYLPTTIVIRESDTSNLKLGVSTGKSNCNLVKQLMIRSKIPGMTWCLKDLGKVDKPSHPSFGPSKLRPSSSFGHSLLTLMQNMPQLKRNSTSHPNFEFKSSETSPDLRKINVNASVTDSTGNAFQTPGSKFLSPLHTTIKRVCQILGIGGSNKRCQKEIPMGLENHKRTVARSQQGRPSTLPKTLTQGWPVTKRNKLKMTVEFYKRSAHYEQQPAKKSRRKSLPTSTFFAQTSSSASSMSSTGDMNDELYLDFAQGIDNDYFIPSGQETGQGNTKVKDRQGSKPSLKPDLVPSRLRYTKADQLVGYGLGPDYMNPTPLASVEAIDGVEPELAANGYKTGFNLKDMRSLNMALAKKFNQPNTTKAPLRCDGLNTKTTSMLNLTAPKVDSPGANNTINRPKVEQRSKMTLFLRRRSDDSLIIKGLRAKPKSQLLNSGENSKAIVSKIKARVSENEGNHTNSQGKNSAPNATAPALWSFEKRAIINRFRHKNMQGTIDVWWLFDDGGLTILLPFIISQRKIWRNCEMRVFVVTKDKRQLDLVHQNFGAMLIKFRIDYSHVIVVPDLHKSPYPTSITKFENIVEKYRVDTTDNPKYQPGLITDTEYAANQGQTFRHIRLHEMLRQHSSNANIIFMTLPIPRKRSCPSALYMSWLEMITCDLKPPILLVRGNQQSVLTFYS